MLTMLPTVKEDGINARKAEDSIVVHALLVVVEEAERLLLLGSRETKCSS